MFDKVFSLDKLNGSNGFAIPRQIVRSGLGDVNGDGIDDGVR